MKKQLLGLITILTFLGACQKNEVSVELSEAVTIHATIEEKDVTRTVMDENNNILWSENDQIIAFMKSSYGHKYQVISSFIGKSYADFSMVSSGNGSNLSAGNAWDHNVVYYPFSENIECLKSGSNYALEVNLPTEQVYVPDSFANGSMAMVAVSENNNITFNNVLGAIKLQLKGTQTVKSIKIEGKNNEKLSGAATVTAYTDETKPAITMASGASTSVTLNCGEGVQLNESSATEFYISLPPVVFTKGFTVTLTDNALQTYVIETDKTNSVLRSGILVMPSVKLESESIPEEDDDTIPVSMVTLDKTILSLPLYFSYTLIAKVAPIDATDTKVTWLSDNPAVINVDQNGAFKTLSAGEANIIAQAGGCYGSCKITVIPQRTDLVDYIDEYGVNHGKGIALGNIVWAPVNCGYKAMTSNNKGFPYGKLYQWGRKYGQGYNLTYDESEPNIMEGPISLKNGMSKEYENVFFSVANYGENWLSTDDIKLLWNSGTIDTPVKTQYDPCPEGWRVPTERELRSLKQTRSSKTTINNQYGYCFSGCYSYVDLIPIVFLPAAGYRNEVGGSESDRRTGGNGSNWGTGHYWSSTAYNKGDSYYNYDWNEYSTCNTPLAYTYYYNSGNVYYQGLSDGKSVRCVQE